MAAAVDRSDPAFAGQAVFTRAFLPLYDTLVYGFNSPVLWRCPKSRLLAHYDAHLSARHLDVGVASGRLLDECAFPVQGPRLTLMDLSPSSLEFAARRLRRYAPRTVLGNALEPWDLPPGEHDSVAMCHILHCMPGDMAEKAVAFEHANTALAPGGVLFGATILGRGVNLNPLARRVIAANNRWGVLSNRDDSPEQLDAALSATFASHELRIVGAVGLFAAWK